MTTTFFNPNIAENFLGRRDALRGRKTQTMLCLSRHHVARHPEDLEALLDHTQDRQVDWVQLHHGNVYEFSTFRDYPKLDHQVNEEALALVTRVIEGCHRRGIKVAWMPGGWNPPAGLFEAYPETRNLQTGAFWEFIYRTTCETLERLPGLDELSTYLFEAPAILHVHHFFKDFHYGNYVWENGKCLADWINDWPYLSFADHVRMLLQAMARGCRDHGRNFSLLTHAWYPYQEELLVDALRRFPSDLPLLLEHNYSSGDFNPALPPSRMLRELPHLRHSLLFCGGLEYNGVAEIPCGYPELMQTCLTHALEQTPNVERITLRPVWDGNSLLGTPNEINLEALLALGQDPLLDTDELWESWATKRYGAAAAAEIADILRGAFTSNARVFFLFGVRTNNHSRLPDFDYLQSRLVNYGKALAEWVPTQEVRQTMYEFIVHPTAKIIRRSDEEHRAALAQIDEALARIEALRDSLAEEDWRALRKHFLDFRDWAALHQWQMAAFLRYRIQLREPSEENAAQCLALLDQLEVRSQAIQAERPDASRLLAPDNVRAFVASIRERLAVVAVQ